MKFPTWSLLVFPILAIVLIIMFPIPAIAVAVSVAIWAVIAAQKAAATKTQDKLKFLVPHDRLTTLRTKTNSRSLEVIRICRGLVDEDGSRPESGFAFYLDQAALVTLGVCYERVPRFGGGSDPSPP